MLNDDTIFKTLQKYVECFVGMWDEYIGIGNVIPIQGGIILECGDAYDEVDIIETRIKALHIIKNVNMSVKYKHNNATITILFDSNLLRVVADVIRDNLKVLNKNNIIGFIQDCENDLSSISTELTFAHGCNYDVTIDWEEEFNTLFEEILLDTLVGAKVFPESHKNKYRVLTTGE